ncbi:MAG: hypothetical protein AABY00_03245 [Nanoarchaeota archaeon]
MTLHEIAPTSWTSMSRGDKYATYCGLAFIAGLIALEVYYRPIVNKINHRSLDPTIQRYDTNRDGKIQDGELELLAKDFRVFQLE